jgi:hypothetical protein
MKKTLQMIFETKDGGTMTLSVSDIKDDLNQAQVSTAMDELLGSGIFISSKGAPTSKKNAKIVTQTVEELSLA